jgi:methyl-accepting chemotaxis protein
LPRLMKNSDSADVLLTTLNENAVTLNKTIANLDDRVNGKGGALEAIIFLTQSLERSAGSLGVTLDTLQRMIAVVSEKTGIIGDEMILLVSNPQLHQMIQNATLTSSEVAKSSQLVTATMEEVREAMRSAPGIASALEKIATTSNKYSRLQILVSILATIARAFL